jgi:hypothetical protein
MEVFKILLIDEKNPGKMCGRGIQYRELAADEVDEADAEAFRICDIQLPPGQPMSVEQQAKIHRQEGIEGAKKMLVAVSKRDKLTQEEFLKLGAEEWEPVDPAKLEMDPKYAFSVLFRRYPDRQAVVHIFQRLHNISGQTVESMMGKAIPVSTAG